MTRSRADSHRDRGSFRIATIGEKNVARHAGKKEAEAATPPTTIAEDRKGNTPTFWIAKARNNVHDASAAMTLPVATPNTANFMPLPTTSERTSRPVAPNAIRVPISTTLWRTE